MCKSKQYVVALALFFIFIFFGITASAIAQHGIISIQTQALNYNGQYLNMSTTQGTVKVHPDKNHSGSKWRIIKDDNKSYLQSQGAGNFLGYYLALKGDGSQTYMTNSRSEASKWRFISIGGFTVIENVATGKFLTVSSQNGKVWSTADLAHSGAKWVIE